MVSLSLLRRGYLNNGYVGYVGVAVVVSLSLLRRGYLNNGYVGYVVIFCDTYIITEFNKHYYNLQRVFLFMATAITIHLQVLQLRFTIFYIHLIIADNSLISSPLFTVLLWCRYTCELLYKVVDDIT